MNKTAYDLGVKTAEVMLEKNAVSMSDILPALEEALAKGTGLGNKARGMHPSNIYPRATGAGLGALAGGTTGALAGDEDNMGTNALLGALLGGAAGFGGGHMLGNHHEGITKALQNAAREAQAATRGGETRTSDPLFARALSGAGEKAQASELSRQNSAENLSDTIRAFREMGKGGSLR